MCPVILPLDAEGWDERFGAGDEDGPVKVGGVWFAPGGGRGWHGCGTLAAVSPESLFVREDAGYAPGDDGGDVSER